MVDIRMIAEIISAFFVVFFFTVLLELPKRYVFITAAAGAIGWGMYLVVYKFVQSPMMAAFGSTLVVSLLGYILARVEKAPVTSSTMIRNFAAITWQRLCRWQAPLPWESLLWILCSVCICSMRRSIPLHNTCPVFTGVQVNLIREDVFFRNIIGIN